MSENPTPTISASDARRAARNIGALVAASILSKGILFVWQIVLGTWLGPFDFGVYNTVIALFSIGTAVANFGIGMIAIREVASAPEKIGKYATSMLFSQTLLSLAAYGVILGGAVLAGYSDMILAFSAIAGISLIMDTFGNVANDLLLAQERMVISSIAEIIHIVLRVALAALALALGWGLLGVYAAMLLSGTVRVAILWSVHIRSRLRLVFPLDWSITRPMLINASPLALAAFLSLAYKHADKLMTTSIIGERGTGFLAPAFLIDFGVTELLSTAVLVAMYPLLSRYFDDEKTDTFGFLVEKLARFMLIVALPIALILTIFAEDIILMLFSEEYAPTIGILRIIIWYTLMAMVGNVFSKALLIQNRQRVTLLIRVASLGLNITLNAWLLLTYRDPRGAAVASVAAEGLALLLMAWAFNALGFNWRRVLGKTARVILLGGVAAVAMLLLGQVHFIIGIGGGVLVYGAGVIFAGILTTDDWDLLYRLVAAMPFGSIIRRYWQRDVVINW